MAGPTKRTRLGDENSSSEGSSSLSSTSSTSTTTPTTTPSAPAAPPAPTPPTTRANSASRRPLTRSTLSSSSSSSFSISTRRTNFALSASSSSSNLTSAGSGSRAMGFGTPSSSGRAMPSGSGARSAGGGMLLRTQSMPVITSASDIKASVGAGGAEEPPKGGCDDGLGQGGRRFGKGKENIPPKKDEDVEAEPARKRPRVTSRGSYSSANSRRNRSGSVASVRSETASIGGRHASLAPSSSAPSISSWGGRLASPSPSQASSSTPSFEICPPADELDRLSVTDARDPTTKLSTKTRPVTRSTAALPTPPPSSPSLLEGDTGAAELLVASEEDQERANSSPYRQLKSALQLSAGVTPGASADDTVVGREDEKATIRTYLGDEATDKDVGMYVSGSPGTGKTALVTALGSELAENGWKVVVLGCMGMKPGDIWKRIGAGLECGKTEKDVREFAGRDDVKVLVILDEIDSLMPSPPAVAPASTSHLLSKIFSLPLVSNTTKLIAISNTLDLTIRARLSLPDGAQPQVLPFKAYSAAEMTAIVNARVASANIEAVKLDSPALTLLGKKVEAQNGDLRMCLGVLCSAISVAEAEYTKKLSQAASDADPKAVPMTKVAVSHILKALTSYTQQLRAAAGSSSAGSLSATAKKIRSVQLQGKMVLVAIMLYLARVRAGMNGCPAMGSGSSTPTGGSVAGGEISASALYATYSHILSHNSSPFPPAAESDYRDLLSNLETLGLVKLVSGTGRNSGAGKVGLCVREEEVREGLGLVEGQSKGVAEEEVKAVWDREDGKLRRAKEKMAKVAVDGES
ncbi:hypothetical protein IAT38_005271 [Cryptococcus sp. DSM 104549]